MSRYRHFILTGKLVSEIVRSRNTSASASASASALRAGASTSARPSLHLFVPSSVPLSSKRTAIERWYHHRYDRLEVVCVQHLPLSA